MQRQEPNQKKQMLMRLDLLIKDDKLGRINPIMPYFSFLTQRALFSNPPAAFAIWTRSLKIKINTYYYLLLLI